MREGTVEAINTDAAAQILDRNGLVPTFLKEVEKTSSIMKSLSRLWEGISQKDLMAFFQQFAILIEARVPIVSALRTISDQEDNKYLRTILKEIADNVEEGMIFSEAVKKYPDVFNALTINVLHAGEVSGELQKSVEIISDNIEKSYQLSSKIKSALYYPIFVLSAAFIIGFLVITFILPKLTLMIKELGVPVPWYTTVLIWLGDFMNAYWWAVLMVMTVVGGGIYYYLNTESGKAEMQLIFLKLPVIGNLARGVYLTRFADTLGALLNGNIPVVKALMIVSQVVGNQVFEKIIIAAANQVKAGSVMSSVFLQSEEIPAIVSQMVRIGEETGTLPHVLKSIGKFYSQEVDNMTRSLTTLIEPVLIVFLGIGVGIMVVGVLLPIYNIAGQL